MMFLLVEGRPPACYYETGRWTPTRHRPELPPATAKDEAGDKDKMQTNTQVLGNQ
jgi:hypothetical protein